MELRLNGFITEDHDGHPALIYNLSASKYRAESIPSSIQSWANYKVLDDDHLGEKISFIPDCSIKIWYTDERCTFDEAQEALCNKLDGCMTVRAAYLGYSEWTITGLNLEEFTIGGHDLVKEIMAHKGEFCWIEVVS